MRTHLDVNLDIPLEAKLHEGRDHETPHVAVNRGSVPFNSIDCGNAPFENFFAQPVTLDNIGAVADGSGQRFGDHMDSENFNA